MTNARSKALTIALIALSSLTLLGSSGCAGALMMPYYLIYGTDSPAIHQREVKEIKKGSKIVVICRSNLNLFGSANPNADLEVVTMNIGGTNKRVLHTKLPIVSDDFMSAFGASATPGASGIDADAMWQLLGASTAEQIAAVLREKWGIEG